MVDCVSNHELSAEHLVGARPGTPTFRIVAITSARSCPVAGDACLLGTMASDDGLVQGLASLACDGRGQAALPSRLSTLVHRF